MVFNLYYILISILFDIYFSRALLLKLGTSLLVSLFYCIVFFYNSLAKLFLNCFCCLLTVTFCHFWGWDPYSKLSQKTSIFNLGHHWFRRVDGDWAWGFFDFMYYRRISGWWRRMFTSTQKHLIFRCKKPTILAGGMQFYDYFLKRI